MMKRGTWCAVVLSLTLTGCGQPVPADRLAYVGEWEQPTMYVGLAADGTFGYWRRRGKGTTSLDVSLIRFHGNDFDVGVGPFETTFVVSKPPYDDHGRWKMVVDGVELTRLAPGEKRVTPDVDDADD